MRENGAKGENNHHKIMITLDDRPAQAAEKRGKKWGEGGRKGDKTIFPNLIAPFSRVPQTFIN